VGVLGLDEGSRLVEAVARLEQVGRQIGPAYVDPEPLDQASARDDGAAGLPERASLLLARLGLALSDETKRAGLGFDLAHIPSVGQRVVWAIGISADPAAGIY
jgi:hypothetical protein